MTHDYKETLYDNLFDLLSELTEHDDSEFIFDRIVEHFALEAEYHMGQADTFKSMLNTFRHDNPVETVPDAPTPPTIDELYGGVSDINRQYMLEDRSKLEEFLKSAKFPDTF